MCTGHCHYYVGGLTGMRNITCLSVIMSRMQKNPMRPPTEVERVELERLSRSLTVPAAEGIRARALLAVSSGASYTDAAHSVGRRSGDAVAQLVARFNQEGVRATKTRHGGGTTKVYGPAEQQRILQEVARSPDREADGTATWSITTLQRALRSAPDGLPRVSTRTIWCVLRDSGYSWQADRSWCKTGQAVRKRKGGLVEIHDPDTIPKKT
jgi:transposase